ncbi:tRNA-dihydrouridine synthase [Halanaeroarchaeum sp. HSR-CO]|uniref:tRNA-dihydrouridine synthase n=1 Tax=Halanaeroarchaeum sp. HSR-CO TaxID=2866382 RepID=UPI00217D08AE|nr:tRNA-dihydrouridine synthase [Halanaeroarchaeum sp. HSR-CO]UWG48524.1 tRNA-dihydrouridine synthase [Halanaeroarchaeum sp. HSR-CO]
MFEPRLALASLSGESDAQWARAGVPYAGGAFLGGLSLDEPTREAAETMVADRDRDEFLPAAPLEFMREQLDALVDVPIRPGFNVRAVGPGAIRPAARICAERGAILEINAHCRQEEMCAAGAGETLLGHPERLAAQVDAAADEGATVSAKVRAEVPDVDLPALAARLEAAGLDAIHVDAMDSEAVIAEVVDATDAFVIANNGVRDERTTREYLAYGADAVSVGRPSDDPAVLERVSGTVREWFA